MPAKSGKTASVEVAQLMRKIRLRLRLSMPEFARIVACDGMHIAQYENLRVRWPKHLLQPALKSIREECDALRSDIAEVERLLAEFSESSFA